MTSTKYMHFLHRDYRLKLLFEERRALHESEAGLYRSGLENSGRGQRGHGGQQQQQQTGRQRFRARPQRRPRVRGWGCDPA